MFMFFLIFSIERHRNQFGLNRSNQDIELTTIYIITPTYARANQIPEITRLAQTLMHVPNIHWLVVEDWSDKNPMIETILKKRGVQHTYLVGPRPPNQLKYPYAVNCHHAAFKWIRENAKSGVIFMADDDNVFDLRVFEQMRSTKNVSVWPVGGMFREELSSPVVKNGKVIDFLDGFRRQRKFALDWAAFAVSVQHFLSIPGATDPYRNGYEEDLFLQNLRFGLDDLEPKGNNCTEILAWHTRTTSKDYPSLNNMKKEPDYENTNLLKLYASMLTTARNKV
ncbi:galactosylgalactosylxylosylprotein 3-beta-glucuronosyltransferase S-like [Limulus polyphemus]|uniref:Galactosylgalactosylxylosylprotein 3-beta-glucuronosyltransferase n=1 Tax=Limulus polyphemus TaxID=6850 RepID=A0ABM1BQM9_LIMPO|nr:galactosylgalactosylxylosylprotein 3-beta-glucuronosyltransferase S-like [Limulus polyphemus]